MARQYRLRVPNVGAFCGCRQLDANGEPERPPAGATGVVPLPLPRLRVLAVRVPLSGQRPGCPPGMQGPEHWRPRTAHTLLWRMAHFELSPASLSNTSTAVRRRGCAGWPWASSCCASSCTSMSAMAPASRTSRCRLRFQGRPQSSRLLLSAPAVVICCLSCPVLDPPVGNWTSLPGFCKARQHKPKLQPLHHLFDAAPVPPCSRGWALRP